MMANYTCVSAKVNLSRGQHKFAVFCFKKNPEDVFEQPRTIKTFDKRVIEELEAGNMQFFGQVTAEEVEYPLLCKMKYPNGIIIDKLNLFCPKQPQYIIVMNEMRFHGWVWMRGYSPEEQAAQQMHILVPIQEQ